ncbi:RelA/SpoT domain-containing protein [Hyphomicrobium sp. NDB2Meth4]|uniref:RelA/SpoT domain-containing protein n=1 Tax=Hyphomicrobium sp. NDB2Meth4 TaxID=1892846 RepID=UPI0009310AB8|nr:RelA/SpoT domain-containing protein [Hyphomicrobium sp. NDB2Meth4]
MAANDAALESLLTDFIGRYARERDHYLKAAQLCQQTCEVLIGRPGIRAMVTSRAKEIPKLRDKVVRRHQSKNYKTVADIESDIVDRAGVRIALYFPGDRDAVSKLLREHFVVAVEKNFPRDAEPVATSKRFSGYHASHFRLRLKEDSLGKNEKAYAQALIEVQLGSVLMHAWSEVDHDLTYKPTTGALSEDELAILDQINGLVLAGEIALERLQKSSERRLGKEDAPIGSHFELAALLHKRFAVEGQEPDVGRVDILWNILQRAGLANKAAIDSLLAEVDPLPDAEPISDQVVTRILSDRPELSQDYVRLQSGLVPTIYGVGETLETADLRDQIGSFLSNWIVLERTTTILVPTSQRTSARLSVSAELLGKIGVNQDVFRHLRLVRNQLVHGIEIPSAEVLDQENKKLDAILSFLGQHPREDVRQAYRKAAAPLNDARG